MIVRDSSRPARRAMTGLAGGALIAFFAALALLPRLPQAVPPVVHVIMAIGVMPLIMGAMIYFTPVLTHGRAPAWPVLTIPLFALIAGLLVTACVQWWRDWLAYPAVLTLLTVCTLFGWMWHRARAMLGRPHPGLYWYLAALVFLFLGVTAILVATFRPEYWMPLKRFHLHANLLGFVGLTAVGTLRVLIPTVAGYTDAAARRHLQVDLYPAAAGVLLIAAGSSGWTWLVWPGLLLWLFPLAGFVLPLISRWRKFVWGWHHPGTSLAAAAASLMLVSLSGGLHAAGASAAPVSLPLFFFLFLFPLVTGAVSYLLPVWVWPARNTPAYAKAERRLAWGSGGRTLLFLLAGAMAWGGISGAYYPAFMGVAIFLGQVGWALSARFSTRK